MLPALLSAPALFWLSAFSRDPSFWDLQLSHRSPKPSIRRCPIILCPEQARTFEVKGRGMRTQILKVGMDLEKWFLCSFQMNELRCNQQVSMQSPLLAVIV